MTCKTLRALSNFRRQLKIDHSQSAGVRVLGDVEFLCAKKCDAERGVMFFACVFQSLPGCPHFILTPRPKGCARRSCAPPARAISPSSSRGWRTGRRCAAAPASRSISSAPSPASSPSTACAPSTRAITLARCTTRRPRSSTRPRFRSPVQYLSAPNPPRLSVRMLLSLYLWKTTPFLLCVHALL